MDVSRNPSFAQPRAIAAAECDHFGVCVASQSFQVSSTRDAKKNKFLVGRISILSLPEMVLRGFISSVAS